MWGVGCGLEERGGTWGVGKPFPAEVQGCGGRPLAPDAYGWRPATAAGFVAHKAIELAINWRGEPAPAEVVDEAMARLAHQADGRGAFVAGLSPGPRGAPGSRRGKTRPKTLHNTPPPPPSAAPRSSGGGPVQEAAKYAAICSRFGCSGRRPCPAAALSSMCLGFEVAGITQLTAG